MVKEIDELAILIAQQKLGDEELRIRDCVDMAGKECIEIEYNTYDLVNLAMENGLTTSYDFDFNTDLANVDDQPPPVVRSSNTQHHAQMLSHFILDNSKFFDIHVVMELLYLICRVVT